MINVDDWAEIRRLYFAERLGIKTIARQLGVARNTVRTAVRGSAPPDYRRGSRGSLVDAVENRICELLRDCPTMPATVIAERIEWSHGITILRDRVAELRPLFRPPDPCQRTHYVPGELVQFDLWQPDYEIPLGFGQADKLWVVTAVSRVLAVHGRPHGPDPSRARRAGRDAVVSRADRRHSPHRRLGRRGLHRSVAPGQAGLHRGVPALPGDPRHGCPVVQAQRPRGEGHERTGQRLLRDLLLARTDVLRRGGLQRPVA